MGTFNANGIPGHGKENLTAEDIEAIKKELPHPEGEKETIVTITGKQRTKLYNDFDRDQTIQKLLEGTKVY